MNQKVLIVDDEESIRRTLKQILEDEGFATSEAEDGSKALEMLEKDPPSLVLLDIWMPGADGLETLKSIMLKNSSLPVIMISGHATIATAVEATRLGAIDFIEKPLDLHATIYSVKKALGLVDNHENNITLGEDVKSNLSSSDIKIESVFLNNQLLKGKKVKQKTLKNSAVLHGIGVHTGEKTGLTLAPLPANSGIHFVGMGDALSVPAYIDNVYSTGLATSLKKETAQVSTIEHLMSALHAYGISNLLIKCNKEVPIMDGSALEFCEVIEAAGVEEQEGEDFYEFVVDKKYRVGTDDEYLEVEPSDSFELTYILDYPKPVGRQEYTFCLKSPSQFKDEIAPARTFGFVKDIGYLQSKGLAQGGRFDNFILIGEEGSINVDLRFPDELVRHKILDMIGDLYLLGRPVVGKFTAFKSGHEDNVAILREIIEGIA